MNAAKGLMTAIGGSLAIALLISIIPTIHFSSEEQVFAHRSGFTLEKGNLADFLAEIPIQPRIHRVSWQEKVLEIDLMVGEHAAISPDEVYRSLYHLASHALVGTTNVEELLIRVLSEQNNAPPLLLASLVAHRTDLAKDLRMSNPRQLDLDLYLSYLFQFSKTNAWHHRFSESTRPTRL